MLAVRAAKIAFVAAFALHASLVVFGNVTDYGTNLEFVRHVLSMDTIFPNSTIRYRAIADPMLQHAAYLTIIVTEAVVAALCWLGAYRLFHAMRSEGRAFNHAKTVAVAGLTLGILLWQVGFITIAGEWFGMWMSHQWNGVPDASRIVMILYAGLILVVMRDDDLTRPHG
jgi:predicted small integral membrane protein